VTSRRKLERGWSTTTHRLDGRVKRLHVQDVGLFDPHPLAGRSLPSVVRPILAMKPRAMFRVYCDRQKRGKFYQVVILRNRQQLQRAARAITGTRRGWSRALGFCHSLDVLRKTARGMRPDRIAGFVIVIDRYIGSGYVTHEMTHAAHFRLCRVGGERRPFECMKFGDRRLQEPLADMTGWLVAQFWSEFYRVFPAATPGIVKGH
jgi:hypothetical protein